MNAQSLDIVRRLAVDTLNLPDSVVATATTLQEAGIDSLSAIDLIFAIEAYFGITIAANDLANMRSLSDLAACVDRLTAHEARRYG
ncbi:MAG: acyl carrier protein [Gammaproteobacteria bacterium]